MTGQLADVPPPATASPLQQPPSPAPASTPAPPAVDSKPVVEASDLTPPAPDTKVVPETLPTPDALMSPHQDSSLSVSACPPGSTHRETPQLNEQKEPVAAEPEQRASLSDSVVQVLPPIPADGQQQKSSEEIAETESAAAEQQSAPVSEIPAVEQQESSSGKASEDHPRSETDISNVEQQARGAPVSGIPAVEPEQSTSENAAEDFSTLVESERQNVLTRRGLDETAAPAEVETELNPKTAESEASAPVTVNERVDPIPEKLPDASTNSVHPEPASIPTVTQEYPPQLVPMPDYSATHLKDETITEVEQAQPSDNAQVEDAPPACQTQSDSVDTAFEVEQSEINKELGVGSVAQEVRIEVDEEIKVEAESVTENAVCIEGARSPAVDVAENEASVDNVEVPKPDQSQRELKQETDKYKESESSSVVSDNKHPVSAAEEKSQVDKVENKAIDKEEEPTPLDPAEHSPHVVLLETKAPEESIEEKPSEYNVFDKLIIERKKSKEKIHDQTIVKDTAEETIIVDKTVEKETIEARGDSSIDNKSPNGKAFEGEGVQKNAAAEKASELKADNGKSLEEEVVEQEQIEKEKDQKPQKERMDKDESSPALSTTAADTISPVIEKIEPDTPAGDTMVETVLLSEKLEEEKKLMVREESLAQREEERTPIDTMLEGDDESANAVVPLVTPPPESQDQEKVNVKESKQSVEMVSDSVVLSEMQVRDRAREKKLVREEPEVSSENNNCCIAVNQPEGERQTSAGDEKPLEEVAEQKVSFKQKEELDTQPAAANIQEVTSVSETSIFSDKNDKTQFDVGKTTISRKDEGSDTALENGDLSASVGPVLQVEPEFPLLVVSEHVKGLKEENANVEEKTEVVAQPLGKPCEEDAVAEVTLVFRTRSGNG